MSSSGIREKIIKNGMYVYVLMIKVFMTYLNVIDGAVFELIATVKNKPTSDKLVTSYRYFK